MGLELEINAATRAFLPEGAMEFATPVRRVELESPHGESRVIIGQLIPTYLNTFTRRPEKAHEYTLLVYRPEFSDIDTNLVAWKEDTPATYEQACEICWEEEFETLISGDCHRFWLPTCASNSFYILFAQNRGTIYRTGERGLGVNFHLLANVENTLYKMSSVEIDQFTANLYADKVSDFRQAVDWLDLDDEKKEEVAFACANGSWSDLREITKWVFRVFLNYAETVSAGEFIWNIVYPSISPYSLTGVNVPGPEGFLQNWRSAIINYFQPKYININGIEKNISLYLEDYISRSEQGRIHLYKPSHHELLEAQLQLSKWAHEHLTIEKAKQLLNF